MRLTLFLPTLAFLFFLPLLASSHVFPHRRDHARQRSPQSSVIAARQYRFPRDLLDVCINVNANLLADASQLLGLSSLLGALNLGADIELCLCLKDLDIYLDTNDSIKALVGLLGKNTVEALITALINTSPEAQHCTFPPHAHHTCNISDPCHFACDPPYIREGDQCICAPPQILCNGVCDIFPQGCSSSVPRAMTKRRDPIVTLAQAQSSCKSGESVCGVPGRKKTLSFECVDTTSTKDSCGGCMTAHPFLQSEAAHPGGMDCSTIPNARTTSCSSSQCVVRSCDDGWVPALDKKNCVPASGSFSKMLKVRKPLDADTDLETTADVNSLVTSVVKLVIALNIHAPGTKLIDAASPSVTDLSNIDTIYNLLGGINAATSGLVSSSSVPLALAYSKSLLDTSSLLLTTMEHSNCIQSLGIQSFSDDLNKLIAAIVNLQAICNQNPNASIIPPVTSTGNVGTTTTATPSTTNPSDSAIAVGLTSLLSDLGIHGKSGVVVDNLVSPDTAKSVNGLLDKLGVGPANYKRQALPPLTAVVNATIGGNSDLLSQLTVVVNLAIKLAGSVDPSASSASTSSSAPTAAASSTTPSSLIPSTNTATGSLVSSLSTCLIDPILFGTLYRYSISLVDSPDLSSFCATTSLLYAAECNLRQLFDECGYVDKLGLGGLVDDLVLIIEETGFLASWCSSNGNVGTTTSTTTILSTAFVTVTSPPTSTTTNSAVYSTSTLVSISSVSLSVGSITSITRAAPFSTLTSSSISSLTRSSTTTTSSSSISSSSISSTIPTPTITTTSAHSVSSSASRFHSTTTTPAHPSDTPIIVSLDDILSDLGLNGTKAVVTVDGLLGNQANAGVNQVLNDLGVGPLNVRRQLVANVNALVDLSGLGGAVGGLVDLVLGLKGVGKALPPVGATASSSSISSTSTLAATPSVIPPLPQALPSLPGVSNIDQGLVNNVVAATLSLLSLSSPTYAQFLQGLIHIANSTSHSMDVISRCACASSSANGDDHLDELYQYLEEIEKAARELEELCHKASLTPNSASAPTSSTIASASAATASPSSSSGDEPIVVGLTKLLKGLGLNVDKADIVVDHLLSNDVGHTVNNVLNSLGVGPLGARRSLGGGRASDW